MLLRFCAALVLFTACIDDTSSDTQASSEVTAESPHPPHPPGPPPQEAVDACVGAGAGDTCAFEIDGHPIDGTCRTDPKGEGPLACAPDQPPPPPQQAIDACASLAAEAACAFDVDDHHVEGTCKTGPDGEGPLACAPLYAR